MKVLNFTGDVAIGVVDMDAAELVCVPSKPHYAEVDLCLKSGDDGKSGMNLTVCQVVGDWLSFEEKQKLGYEIEKRWNAYSARENQEGKTVQLPTGAW